MKVGKQDYRTVWMDGTSVMMIEQNLLPYQFSIVACGTYQDTCRAIRNMTIRGAGAIGAAAGYAMAQAILSFTGDETALLQAKTEIENTRPTAWNLFYAVDRVYDTDHSNPAAAIAEANKIADDDARDSQAIGKFGNELIDDGYRIGTHCNAGWLAFVDYGTALSPVYLAHEAGKKVFVYVDETRPRGQGARLTAWELHNAGVSHAIIPDNAMAYYMSQGKIDMMIVGADRISANGDVANKIGTLEKAIAAYAFKVPFYVAAPTSTIDMASRSGSEIPIEERNQDEVLYQTGPDREGVMREILVASPGSAALNPAFDVTPAQFITGIITEKGIVKPGEQEIASLF
jgi:S-methyl-5-thioribose-1-phosphate isomerase